VDDTPGSVEVGLVINELGVGVGVGVGVAITCVRVVVPSITSGIPVTVLSIVLAPWSNDKLRVVASLVPTRVVESCRRVTAASVLLPIIMVLPLSEGDVSSAECMPKTGPEESLS
jgi:hypothetical protein